MFDLAGQGTPTIEDYAEIIGTVLTANKIKMMTCVNLGQELGEPDLYPRYNLLQADVTTAADMELANNLVELIHGPQREVREMFF